MVASSTLTLSVVVITFNEAANIKRCLDSIQAVADEIIIVDSFSTDATKEICLAYTKNFVEHPFEGHIQQKNYALSLAKGDYILSLDADEALSVELVREILRVKHLGFGAKAFTFNRMTHYCGKFIKHGSWYPDVSLRLWKNGVGKWEGTNPHDYFHLESAIKAIHLKGDLLHYSYASISSHLKQIDYFSGIASQALFEKRTKISWMGIVIKTKFRFLYDYILRAGFLDGSRGCVIAVLSSYAVFVKYTKLKYLYASERD